MEASDKPTKLVSIRILEIDVTKLSVKLNGEFVVLCIKREQHSLWRFKWIRKKWAE